MGVGGIAKRSMAPEWAVIGSCPTSCTQHPTKRLVDKTTRTRILQSIAAHGKHVALLAIFFQLLPFGWSSSLSTSIHSACHLLVILVAIRSPAVLLLLTPYTLWCFSAKYFLARKNFKAKVSWDNISRLLRIYAPNLSFSFSSNMDSLPKLSSVHVTSLDSSSILILLATFAALTVLVARVTQSVNFPGFGLSPYLNFAYVNFFKPHDAKEGDGQQSALESFYAAQVGKTCLVTQHFANSDLPGRHLRPHPKTSPLRS